MSGVLGAGMGQVATTCRVAKSTTDTDPWLAGPPGFAACLYLVSRRGEDTAAVKYMLYGSSTGIVGPLGLPVMGSIGVRLLDRSLVTYSVVRSHDGTTCWGSLPTA